MWLELLKDHDISALYHLDKANIVVDALRLMNIGSMTHVEDKKKDIVRDVHRSPRLGVQMVDFSTLGFTIVQNHSW